MFTDVTLIHWLLSVSTWTAICMRADSSICVGADWDDLIVLFYMDSLNKTRSLFYIEVHVAKKALI